MKKYIFYLFLALLLVGCETSTKGPTITPKPTNTLIPSHTPRPTHTPSPTNTPKPEPNAEITQISYYVSSSGIITFIALVDNIGELPLEYVKMHVTVLDGNGTLLASNYSYSTLNVIFPGNYSPISVNMVHIPDGLFSYDVTLEFQEAKEPIMHYPNIEILNHNSSTAGSGTTNIIGEVKNTGEDTAAYVKLIAVGYDVDGNLVGFNYSYTDFVEIPPNGTSPYSVNIYDEGLGTLNYYELMYDAMVDD